MISESYISLHHVDFMFEFVFEYISSIFIALYHVSAVAVVRSVEVQWGRREASELYVKSEGMCFVGCKELESKKIGGIWKAVVTAAVSAGRCVRS